MRTLLVTLFFFNVMLAPSTWAASGGYIGASLGSASVDDPAGLVDDSDTGVKLFGGFRLNNNFAVEAFYADFGDPETFSFGSLSSEEITGFGVQIVGIAPLSNQVELFGKLGLISWDEDYKIDGSVTFSDSGTDLTYGFGATFHVNDMVSIRGEWEFYDVEDSFGDIDVDLLSIGVQVNF